MKNASLCLMIPLLLVGGVYVLACYQGIDLADEWFWYSNAHVLSVAPDKSSYSFGYYLSVAIASMWGRIVGDSLISFRFLAVLSKLLIIGATYFIMRNFIGKATLSLGLVVGGLFTYGGVMCFYGNTCTSLFYMVAVVFAYRWLFYCKGANLFMFGFVLGVGAFARIANVTDLLFLFIIPFYRLIEGSFELGRIVRELCIAVGGWVAGVVSVISMMVLAGHWDAFLEMLEMYAYMAGAGDSGHSLAHLINCQLKYYLDVFYYSSAAAGVVVSSVVAALLARNYGPWSRQIIVFSVAIASSIVLGRFLLLLCRFEIVFAFICCFALACFFEKRPKALALWAMAFLCLTVSPLGSDVAGTSNKYCMPFYVTLVFSAFAQDGVVENAFCKLLRMTKDSVRNIRMVLYGLMMFLCVGIVYQIWQDPIRDNSNRRLLTTCAKVNGLEGVRTTPERAKAIESIVMAINEHADPGQPLLVFHSAPGLHALTGMLPYTCSTWSFLLTPTMFNVDIVRAQKRFDGQLPLVVLAKWAVGCREWPQERKAYMNSDNLRWGRRMAFDRFLSNNNYQTIFENEDFVIFKAEEK